MKRFGFIILLLKLSNICISAILEDDLNTQWCKERIRCNTRMDWYNSNCFCDSLCLEYGDCCLVSPFYKPNEMKKNKDKYECIIVESENYYIKSKCAEKWDDEVTKDMCLKKPFFNVPSLTNYNNAYYDNYSQAILLHLPVTSVVTNITYKNLHCSICNGEYVQNMVPWDTEIGCIDAKIDFKFKQENLRLVNDELTYFDSVTKSNYSCEIQSVKINENIESRLRKCRIMISSCPESWKNDTVEELCSSYTSIVYSTSSNYKSYRNMHCALCNEYKGSLSCFPNIVLIPRNEAQERPFDRAYFVPTFKFIFNFKNSYCEEGSIWDQFTKKCREIYCTENISSDKCKKNLISGKSVNDSTSNSLEFNNCIKIPFSEEEYKFGENGTILIAMHELSYTNSQYTIDENGTAFVCYQTNQSTVMAWLSILGTSLSCVCLILHIISFFLVPDLRNLTARNLSSMGISLLIGYICFLIVVLNEFETCRKLGAVMYFGFMSSFAWMNVMAFDIWKTIKLSTSESRLIVGKQWKKYIYYSFYAWSLPIALLILMWFLNTSKPSFIPSQYLPIFDQRMCWLQNKAILIYFTFPVSVIIVANAIFFFITMQLITNNFMDVIQSNEILSPRLQLKICIRLSLIMGISWITGIIGGYVQNEFVWYVFVLLTSFQGVYIFIAFTCRRKVYKSLKLLLHKKIRKVELERESNNINSYDASNSNVSNVTTSTDL